MSCGSMFFEALKEVLPLRQIIEEKCFGCSVHHPSQRQHDLCLMSGYGAQVLCCYKEALERVPRLQLMEALVRIVEKSNTDFIDVFNKLFIKRDPLERIKHDTDLQLEFICFLLDKKKPLSGHNKERICSICYDFDIENGHLL